jgi:Fe-S-cluster containining protein
MCSHCDKGCSIYENRPESCVNFNCNFIEDGLGIHLRPDNTNIIFEKVTTKIYMGLIDPEFIDSWNTGTVKKYIKELNENGTSVVMTSFKTGILNVYCAPEHNKEKVIEISLRSAS